MVLVGASGCAAAARPAPNRPRFVHVPRELRQHSVHARAIRVELRDGRAALRRAEASRPVLLDAAPGRGRIEVPLPADYGAALRRRSSEIASGTGEALLLDVTVGSCFVEARDGAKHVEVQLRAELRGEDGTLIAKGSGTAFQDLLGPPHDEAELDAMHRAAAQNAFDELLANVLDAGQVNPILAQRSAR